jgi:hypothetical protein
MDYPHTVVRPHRLWLLVGRLLVGRNTKEAMIRRGGDQREGLPLLVCTRLVDVPLRDTHGRAEGLLLVA